MQERLTIQMREVWHYNGRDFEVDEVIENAVYAGANYFAVGDSKGDYLIPTYKAKVLSTHKTDTLPTTTTVRRRKE